jgi:hypothetical protein
MRMLKYNFNPTPGANWNTSSVRSTVRAIIKLDLMEANYMVGLLADIKLYYK